MKSTTPWAMALIFALAFVCLGFWYAPLVAYQESLHLFVYDTSFIGSWLQEPGGGLSLMEEFVAQFYYQPMVGAFIISFLLTYIALAGAKLYFKGNFLSCVVPLLLLYCLSDSSFTLIPIIGSALVMSFAWLDRKWPLSGYSAPVFVVLMFLISPFFGSVLALLLVFSKLFKSPRADYKEVWVIVLAWCVVVGVAYFWIYPSVLLSSLLIGNFFVGVGSMYYWFLLFLVFSPAIGLPFKRELKWWINLVVVLVGFVLLFLASSFNSLSRSLLDMDHQTRNGQWDEVLKIADRYEEISAQHTFYVALALNQTHKMGDSLFNYRQLWGSDVLYDNFNSSQMSLFRLSELYMALGHTNFAYRMAMENLVLNRSHPSGRMLKMMASCALINQDFGVAIKYLTTLSHTLYYRQWAIEQLKSQNIDWIEERKTKLPTQNSALGDGHNSYLYFKLAHQANPTNVEVLDYLLADVLLKGRLDIFVSYLPQASALYPVLPEIYQQAAAIHWAQTGDDNFFARYVTSKNVIDKYREFTKILSEDRLTVAQREAMFDRFKNTYFYYFVKLNNETPKSNTNTGSVGGGMR